jgi:hypothetical protein
MLSRRRWARRGRKRAQHRLPRARYRISYRLKRMRCVTAPSLVITALLFRLCVVSDMSMLCVGQERDKKVNPPFPFLPCTPRRLTLLRTHQPHHFLVAFFSSMQQLHVKLAMFGINGSGQHQCRPPECNGVCANAGRLFPTLRAQPTHRHNARARAHTHTRCATQQLPLTHVPTATYADARATTHMLLISCLNLRSFMSLCCWMRNNARIHTLT